MADIECGSTKRVRLFLAGGDEKAGVESKARVMIGHKVTVTGRLHRRTMMSEITPVFMEVMELASTR
jgi:hypothetical protein